MSDYKIVCKICAVEMKIDQVKEHSNLCKTRAELNQEVKNLEINPFAAAKFNSKLFLSYSHTRYIFK